MHLGVADPGRDFVLVQILEEPQHDDLAFQLRQRSDQAGQNQYVFWLLPDSRRHHQIAQTSITVDADGLVK